MVQMKWIGLLVTWHVAIMQAQTPCVNGFAGPYPCSNVDLLFHMSPAQFGGGTTNEVWGWYDETTQIEYVLLGKSNGVAFISIEDPLNPVHIGTLPSHTFNSLWRTFRVYHDYLFVGSEASGHGIQVFDLTHLRDVESFPVTFSEDAWYGGFGKCHTLSIDEESQLLFACGTNTFSGGLHIVDISDPLAPVIAGGYDLDGYTHEAQIVRYDGPDADYTGHLVAICFNGNNPANMTIADVTDPLDATTISITPYPQSAYCHQGWLSPDRKYLLMDDELDEWNHLFSHTRTLIWNVEDLDHPHFMGNFIGTTTAIDHNQILLGNLSFQSNYTAGLRLLDISHIEDTLLTEVGYFDHYPSDNSVAFDGEWMSYPYFNSGVVPLTDIDYGLFLVRPNFMHLDSDTYQVCSTGDMNVEIELAEGFSGPVNLALEGLPEGVEFVFSSQAIYPPGTVNLHLSHFESAPASFEFKVIANGAHFGYSRTIDVSVMPAQVWFLDADGDGFGNDALQAQDCIQPEGYSLQPVNCNGVLEGAENIFCADVDGDGVVTVIDILMVTGGMGCTPPCIPDLNDDGIVNITDLQMVLSDYGDVCE
jgi:choice-of-anchor B domain-containing protein